ncbi:MAG: KH domain-containing protein [Oscillatoriophycideae cyanobacterium NC_groundwater_1537_Pr4_S-0.65um_50_18]|nr:KH domain-containing protein [Oscillatoriophycideae cyanobacterium NC_groundwater_1537_Pr4_S-0.65um_50_18]
MSTVPDQIPSTPAEAVSSPDYAGLVRFLVLPFLESPDSLRVDCEISPRTSRVLVRVAFEGEDKGRVFGRGGRNIQAIRTVLQAVAQSAGKMAHLEVFGSSSADREPVEEKAAPPRVPPPRPIRSQPR